MNINLNIHKNCCTYTLKACLMLCLTIMVITVPEVMAGRKIPEATRNYAGKLMLLWRQNTDEEFSAIQKQVNWASPVPVNDDLFAELLLRTQQTEDGPLIHHITQAIIVHGGNPDTILATARGSTRFKRSRFQEDIVQKLTAMSHLRLMEKDEEGLSDQEGLSDPEDLSDSEKKNLYEEPHLLTSQVAAFKVVPDTHPPSYFYPLPKYDGVNPFYYSEESHQFNKRNILSFLALLGPLPASAKQLHQKLQKPKKGLTRKEARQLVNIEVENVITLLVTSGKLSYMDLFPVLQAYNERKRDRGRLQQLRLLDQILVTNNPLRLPQEHLEINLPLLIFRQLQLSAQEPNRKMTKPGGIASVIDLYVPNTGVNSQNKRVWENIYKVLDGLEIHSTQNKQDLSLRNELAESALADNISQFAGVMVDDIDKILEQLIEISPQSGKGAQHPLDGASFQTTGDLHTILNLVSTHELFDQPCTTVFKVLFSYKPEELEGMDTEEMSDAMDDFDDLDEEFADEIPQRAVKLKFIEVIKAINNQKQIKALGEVCIEVFGYCPIELINAYKQLPKTVTAAAAAATDTMSSSSNSLTYSYHFTKTTNFSQKLWPSDSCNYDRRNPFIDNQDLTTIKKYGSPSHQESFTKWGTLAENLGFKSTPNWISASGSVPQSDQDKFWEVVSQWVNQDSRGGLTVTPTQLPNWQLYGNTLIGVDQETAKKILRNVWITYFKEEAEQKQQAPERFLRHPARREIMGADAIVPDLAKMLYDLFLKRAEDEHETRQHNSNMRVQKFARELFYLPITKSLSLENDKFYQMLQRVPSYSPLSSFNFKSYGLSWITMIVGEWVQDKDSAWIDLLRALDKRAYVTTPPEDAYLDVYNRILAQLSAGLELWTR